VQVRWDADYRVSKTAVESLGAFGEQSLSALQEALENDSLPDQAAVRGLELIGGPAVDSLIQALAHPRLPTRRAAANALVRLYISGDLEDPQMTRIVEVDELIASYAKVEIVYDSEDEQPG